jgi:hypothetical protein
VPSTTIDPRLLGALRKLYERLVGTDVVWAVTGSLNHALRGLRLRPRDIDLRTDERGAYAMERLFGEHVTKNVGFKEAANVRSHFGELNIDGVTVEVIGDIETWTEDEGWVPAEGMEEEIQFIEFEGMRLPVFSLEDELSFYIRLGRPH